MKEIISAQNPFVKKLLQLAEKSRVRKKEGLCVIEGLREVQLAIQGGYELQTILYQPELLNESVLQELLTTYHKPTEVIAISKEVYAKLSYRSSTEGIIAVARTKATI